MQKRRSTSKTKDVVANSNLIKDAVISYIYSMKLVGNEQDIVDVDIHPDVGGQTPLTIYYRKEASLRPKKTE